MPPPEPLIIRLIDIKLHSRCSRTKRLSTQLPTELYLRTHTLRYFLALCQSRRRITLTPGAAETFFRGGARCRTITSTPGALPRHNKRISAAYLASKTRQRPIKIVRLKRSPRKIPAETGKKRDRTHKKANDSS